MEVWLHQTDGERFVFHQDDENQAARMFASIEPFRFFRKPQIIIQGRTATHGFSPASIEAVEFFGDVGKKWELAGGLQDCMAISEDRYLREFDKRTGLEARRVQVNVKMGEPVTGLGVYTMKSGRRFYFIYEVVAQGRLDARSRIQSFLDSWGFPARRESGGWLLVNPKNITQWSLHPGPPVAPTDAWYASRIE